MDGFISSKRTFEDFKRQIPAGIKTQFEELRDYCLSLGENVIEDVRMHRIVFCKSISFRWFADMEPNNDEILLKIQTSRKEPQTIVSIKKEEQIEEIKETIKQAFEKIH